MLSPITVTLLNHNWRGSVTRNSLIHLRYLRYQAIIQDFPREVFRLLSHLVMIISRKLLLHQGASGSCVLFVDLYSQSSQSLSLDLDQNLLSPRSKDMIPIKARPSAVRRVESRSACLSLVSSQSKGENRNRQSENSAQLSRTFIWTNKMLLLSENENLSFKKKRN